jgi:DNA-binding transcriptional LysR family regulator
MNYSRTAERLNLTQPAITQHIQYLERMYECKLFVYDGKKLNQTAEGHMLENYARTEQYNNRAIKQKINEPGTKPLKIGATKTIGGYVIKDLIMEIGRAQDYALTVVVDNTQRLLYMIDHSELDFALIEGSFEKQKYGYKLMRNEPYHGVCSSNHPFAGRKISMKEMFSETMIIREAGSGTRAIFEHILRSKNFTLNDFEHKVCLNDFRLIEECVMNNIGITFAYESLTKHNPRLENFEITDHKVEREFNYVYLKNSRADELVDSISKMYGNEDR